MTNTTLLLVEAAIMDVASCVEHPSECDLQRDIDYAEQHVV
jgi:hypothetical protein